MAYLFFHHSNDAMIRRKLLPSKLDQMTHIQRCVSNDSKNDLVGGAMCPSWKMMEWVRQWEGWHFVTLRLLCPLALGLMEGWHPIYEMENKKCLKPPTKWCISLWPSQLPNSSPHFRRQFSRVVSNVTAKIHTSSKRTSCGTKLFRARFLTTRCDSLKGSPRVLFSDWLSVGRINKYA